MRAYLAMRLLERSDSLLLIIDAQPGFYGHAPLAEDDTERLEGVLARCSWLAGVATALGVPVMLTEEDPDRNGPTDASVLARLPGDSARFTKPVFGLGGNPEILAAVEATGHRTAVLAGLETDVCVTHSALGLLDLGFRVVAITDGLFSPGTMHHHGLSRMSDAGVELVHAKGLYYEWVRTLDGARAFEVAHPDLADPPGFAL